MKVIEKVFVDNKEYAKSICGKLGIVAGSTFSLIGCAVGSSMAAVEGIALGAFIVSNPAGWVIGSTLAVSTIAGSIYAVISAKQKEI